MKVFEVGFRIEMLCKQLTCVEFFVGRVFGGVEVWSEEGRKEGC